MNSDKKFEPTVVVATIAAERKDYSLQQCLLALRNLTYFSKTIYVNYQTESLNAEIPIGIPVIANEWDVWGVNSTWQKRPKYNQDPARLNPIVTARNMAIDFAVAKKADWLLFVDSDVIVNLLTIEKFLKVGYPLMGGVVPGRGAHSHAKYVFGVRSKTRYQGIPVTTCNHGTMGLCMISKSIFQYIRFRVGNFSGYWWSKGLSKSTSSDFGSEDPLFAEDAESRGLAPAGWVVLDELTAEHLDNPADPLTEEVAAPTYNEP